MGAAATGRDARWVSRRRLHPVSDGRGFSVMLQCSCIATWRRTAASVVSYTPRCSAFLRLQTVSAGVKQYHVCTSVTQEKTRRQDKDEAERDPEEFKC